MSNLPTEGKAMSEHNPFRCSVSHLTHKAWAAAVGPSPWWRGYRSPDARLPLPWWKFNSHKGAHCWSTVPFFKYLLSTKFQKQSCSTHHTLEKYLWKVPNKRRVWLCGRNNSWEQAGTGDQCRGEERGGGGGTRCQKPSQGPQLTSAPTDHNTQWHEKR